MFKALMGGGSRDDASSRPSRRKSSASGGDDSRTSSRRQSKRSSASSVSSSRKSTRGDDRDRGLGDLSANRSVTGDSTTTYVTAEPSAYDEQPVIIERTPRYIDRDDDRPRTSRDTLQRDSKRRERRDTEEHSTRSDMGGEYTYPRTRSGDDILNPSSSSPSAQYVPVSSGDTTAHFAAEIGNPGFNQFPMQYDSTFVPATTTPYQPPLDSHISQQFPGQLPDTITQPYLPENPAGHAADYYGDQGQSVAHQPGVRPQPPDIIVGAQPHLQPASPMANPPPEPSSLGQVGAAADYYAAADSTEPLPTTTTTSVKPPKPGKLSRPTKPTSGASVAAESATFGIGSDLLNQASSNYPVASGALPRPPTQGNTGNPSSQHGVGLALGGAAAGAAAAYMISQHEHSGSNAPYSTQINDHETSYGIGIPPHNGSGNLPPQGNIGANTGTSSSSNRPPFRPASYSSGGMQPGSLAYHQRHHDPVSAFVDFWRDPEGVGKFEDYTEAIGVCKYCFEPGTTSKDAPRKHHYHRRRRSPVVERYGSSSRVDKLTRYASSEDESRRKKSKGSSWLTAGLTGGLAGYVAKSLFSSKDFEDTYHVRSGERVGYLRRSEYDQESVVSSSKASSTSRGVVSKRQVSDDKLVVIRDSKSHRYSRRSSQSRSRSRSRERRGSSGLKEAAIGAAVGSALSVAAAQSSSRNESRSSSVTGRRRRISDSSESMFHGRSGRRGRSSPKSFKSFFTAPSANRRKKHSQKKRGFFFMGNSSSSSGDFDLAFGGSELYSSTVSGKSSRSSRSSKSSKSSKKHSVDAKILGLGLAATQLANSSSYNQLSPRDLARPSRHRKPQVVEDEEWEDTGSSDSSVSRSLAYGGTAQFSSRESLSFGSSFWPWRSRKQENVTRQFDTRPAAMPSNDFLPYTDEYGSYDGSSAHGSLQQVYPVPTGDPSRFDVIRMSKSSSPNDQPPLIRPGPIPLQQPQPVTPLSQSVYHPNTIAPVVPDMLARQVDLEGAANIDIPRHRRSNSSPVLPLVPLESTSAGILKRRSTTKDSATVSFDLTKEQVDREQEVDRRNRERKERQESRRDEFAVLREEAEELERRRERKERRREERRRREDAEAEEIAREAQRERLRKEKMDQESRTSQLKHERREQESSSWVAPAAVGVGAAAAAGVLVGKVLEDEEPLSRFEERREKRRSQRRQVSESQSEVTDVIRRDEIKQVTDEEEKKKRERRIAEIAASRIAQDATGSPVYESYQDFFLPEELRHSEKQDPSSASTTRNQPVPETPYPDTDGEKPNPSWLPLIINIIQPTPPASHDGSVRDANSPVPTPEPSVEENHKGEEDPIPSRPTTGSRVSWGEHQTHEYEVDTPLSDKDELFNVNDQYEEASTPTGGSEERNNGLPKDVPIPRDDGDSELITTQSMPGSFDENELEFAATVAAGTQIAGFDPTVVTNNESYYRKHQSSDLESKSAYHAPAVESVEDLGDATLIDTAQERHIFTGDEEKPDQDPSSSTREVTALFEENGNSDGKTPLQPFHELDNATKNDEDEKELQDESEFMTPPSEQEDCKKSMKSKRNSKNHDNFNIDVESGDFSRRSFSSERRQDQIDNDNTGFETALKKVESDPVRDDWIEEEYKERRRRKSKRGSTEHTEPFDDARSIAASAPGADELEEYRKSKSSSSSKREEADFEQDDNRSLPGAEDEGEKRRRRRHKRHSGDFDDTASVVSSPAKIDEVREKRRSRESSVSSISKERQKEQDKKPSGFFSNLFGSKTNLERPSSSSGKRETRSEVGVDEATAERRRKKRSSGGRSSSGDGLGSWEVSSEAAQSTVDLSQLGEKHGDEGGDDESRSSRRRRREKQRRDKYEEIVDSARDTSAKERYAAPDENNDDEDQGSFLERRPGMPPLNDNFGDSGLATNEAPSSFLSQDFMGDQLQQVQQRLRSRSVSPSMAEKTFELAPRSQSRPSSPIFGEGDQEIKPRRLSVFNDSPTAVPLHFRKPPTSPSSSKRTSLTSPNQQQSPSSPRTGHRRPNSIEFKNVREIRPLWLVERHSSGKFDTEPEGPLPSLPSSKTSSRAPSMEDLREAFDGNAVAEFYVNDSGLSGHGMSRKPINLRISTDQPPVDEEDYLNSQQATPTAETYNAKQSGPPPIKKEKPKYEFHSPSELLQDPSAYQQPLIPDPPESMERLPSVAGSDLEEKEIVQALEEKCAESGTQLEKQVSAPRDKDNSEQQHPSGIASFLAGASFASIVDAAVSHAVGSQDKMEGSAHSRGLPATDDFKTGEFVADVDRKADEDVLHDYVNPAEQGPSISHDQAIGTFGTEVDAGVPVAISGHDNSTTEDKTDVSRDTKQVQSFGEKFPNLVDVAVAAAAIGESGLPHTESTQPNAFKDVIGLDTGDLTESKAENDITSEVPSMEEPTALIEEPIEDSTMQESSSKKQKRKEKKKKKSSKDFRVIEENKNSEEGKNANAPGVELDSSAQAEGEPGAERAELTGPINEAVTAEEDKITQEPTETIDSVNSPSEQSLLHDIKENFDNISCEPEQVALITEQTEQLEAVTAVENDTRPGPSADQETTDTNDQAPHVVVAESVDDSSTQPLSKSQKKKKNKKKKSQSLSDPGAIVLEDTLAAPVTDESAGPSVTDETQEKSLREVFSASMPSEQVKNVENEHAMPMLGEAMDNIEKSSSSLPESGLIEEQGGHAMAADIGTEETSITEQDPQIVLEAVNNEQQWSPYEETSALEVTTEKQPSKVTEVFQEANHRLLELSEISERILVEEPLSEEPINMPSIETSTGEKPVDSAATTGSPAPDEKDEEQAVAATSGKKSKNKKKKKKSKSQSVDEGPSEAPQEFFDAPQAQPDNNESVAVATEPVVDADNTAKDEFTRFIDPGTYVSPDVDVPQSIDSGNQDNGANEVAVETLQQDVDLPHSETLLQKQDNVDTAEDKEVPILTASGNPEQSKVATEPQASNIADVLPDSGSPESLSPGKEFHPSDEQPAGGTEEVEPAIQENSAPVPQDEVTETPAPAKSKQKKGKKGKRVSWAEEPDTQVKEEPEVIAETVQTGQSTPVEPEEASLALVESSSPIQVEEITPDSVKPGMLPNIGDESTVPAEVSLLKKITEETVPTPADPDLLSPKDTNVPRVAEIEAPSTAEIIEQPNLEHGGSLTAEPSTVVDKETVLDVKPILSQEQQEDKDRALSLHPEQQNNGEEILEQTIPQELESSQADSVDKPAEADIEDAQAVDSKKRKKEKKKDKKRKKTAEALALEEASDKLVANAQAESAQATTSETPKLVEQVSAEQSNLDEQVTSDVKDNLTVPETLETPELVEKVILEQSNLDEQITSDIKDNFTALQNLETHEPVEKLIVEQSNLDEQITSEDNLTAPQLLETPVEEAKSIDIEEDNAMIQETPKSKKKKDKKKKAAAAAALALEQEASNVPENETTADPAEAVNAASQEQAELVYTETPNSEETKLDVVAEDRQVLEATAETPAETSTDIVVQTSTEAITETPTEPSAEPAAEPPTEEANIFDVAEEDTFIQETSKSKKKKDKKKKASDAFKLDEEQSEKSATKETDELPESSTSEYPKQFESESSKQLGSDEQVEGNIVEDTAAESQAPETPTSVPKEISTSLPPETPIETKPFHTIEDNSLVQESSKSKKKKDKKKKKAAESLLGGEEQAQTPVTEDATKLGEASSTIPEQPMLKEEQSQTAGDYDTVIKPQQLEASSSTEEAVETVDDPEDDGFNQETSSKSKKKDKKKKKTTGALLNDELSEKESANDVFTGLGEGTTLENAVIEQGPPSELQIAKLPVEEARDVEIAEDDGWVQENSKSKKKKDKKKNRQSIQLEPAQEEATLDAAAEEISEITEIAPVVESSFVAEDTFVSKDEQEEVTVADVEQKTVPQDEVQPLQPGDIEGEDSESKTSKSKKKKKKGKKNDSKYEPLVLGVKPEPDEKEATAEITESVEPPAITGIETLGLTNPSSEMPTEPQFAEPADSEQLVNNQEPAENSKPLEAAESVGVEETQPEDKVSGGLSEEKSLEPTELTEPNRSMKTAEIAESPKQKITKFAESVGVDAEKNPAQNAESLDDGREASGRKSGKKSKKKKRQSIQWDEPPPTPTEQQELLASPPVVGTPDEMAVIASYEEETQAELALPEEPEAQREKELVEPENIGPVDENADIQDMGGPATEINKPPSVKEKRKEKKKKRRTLDLSLSEPDPVGTDEVASAPASAWQLDKIESPKDEKAASDEFSMIDKKEKQKKRQSVSWEDEIIEAATEDEPKSDEVKELDEIEVAEGSPPALPVIKNIDSNLGQHEESVLQETPVEVDGKETFQSSETDHTDKKEKDFDWTDNMVSPQVHSQTEESPFPVPSPTFDDRKDTEQPRLFVDDSQSGEIVKPENLTDNQPLDVVIAGEGMTESPAIDASFADKEEEDYSWVTTKNAKGTKKKQKSLSSAPEESSLINDEPPNENLIEAEVKSDFQELPENLSAQNLPTISDLRSQPEVGTEMDFKDVSSSKKKDKKKKGKVDRRSSADIEEPASDYGAVNADQEGANPTSDEVAQEDLVVDIGESRANQEPAIEVAVDKKDDPDELSTIPREIPEDDSVARGELPVDNVVVTSEPLARKLSKKEKRKLKKEKSIAEEEKQELVADPVENETGGIVSEEHIAETMEENDENPPVNSRDISIPNNQLVVKERTVHELDADVEEPGSAGKAAEPRHVQEQPIVRKLSKKEKKKNKKRMTENMQEEKSMEASPAADVGGSLDVVTDPVASEEQKFNRDPTPEAFTGQEEPEHTSVSLDPFDIPETNDSDPTNLVSTSRDIDDEKIALEPITEQRQDAEAAMQAKTLEKEADLDVAMSLFEDSPAPQQTISRQSSNKQKGKKNKKEKRGSQQKIDKLKEASEGLETRDNIEPTEETSPSGETLDVDPQISKPVGKDSQSWTPVDFDSGSNENYKADECKIENDDPELDQREISTEDVETAINQFGSKVVREVPRSQIEMVESEPTDPEFDQFAADDTKSTNSQSEDVDIAVETAMAAAGFLSSSITSKTRPRDESSAEIHYKDYHSEVYEQNRSIPDTVKTLETADTSFETTGGDKKTNKIANIFPGLERVSYRRPSPKSHEKQAVSLVPNVTRDLTLSESQSHHEAIKTMTQEREMHEFYTPEVESTSKIRSSSLLFDSSPSTRLEPTPDAMRASSPTIRLQRSSGSLHRTKSIHGHHVGPTHSWQLDDEKTPLKRASSPSPIKDLSPPRTPLDPIREVEGPPVASPSPRLIMGEEPYVLERPDSRGTSLRKTNRNISADLRAAASHSHSDDYNWLSADAGGPKKDKAKRDGRQEAGWAAPSATDRSQPPEPHQAPDHHIVHDHDHDQADNFNHIPSSSTYDPVTDKGKRPARGMTDVYEAWGETPNSPRSPTRPPSVRRRQSMQHLQELEARLDQLISENHLLAAAKEEAEQKLSRVGVARRKSDQALNTSNADLRDKEAEIARLTNSLEWMQSEVQRLTQENESVHATHAELTASHAREIDGLRTRQIELATGMEGIVRDQISAALAEKDVELRRLRDELAAARQTVQELQQQIVAATADDVLSIHDEDYFDNACQRLCQHVQQWVLRFSKHSDTRRCRSLAEVRDTNIADRFENAILDGTDVDIILADRVRRRDVFVAVVMAMIWEYIFTRYLFGMDREQRQKLKALEKQLSDIGPRRAVAHWRALTLTLLAKRPSFADQRAKDTEAVALEIMDGLSQLLPPPQAAQSQLLESLRGVLRRAANLSIEMRTQRAEYVMLPPLQPEFDSQGDLARQVSFNASLMNERSGTFTSNEALAAQNTAVRLVLFPLVVKKGNDLGDGDEEIVVCPAQVLVPWPENERSRDRMSALGHRSVSSVVPSVTDMGNAI